MPDCDATVKDYSTIFCIYRRTAPFRKPSNHATQSNVGAGRRSTWGYRYRLPVPLSSRALNTTPSLDIRLGNGNDNDNDNGNGKR
jgi:hypothetical protein